MSARYEIPSRIDLSGAGEVAKGLLALTGQPLVLDGSKVTQISTPGLQVLLAAARSWRDSGQPLNLDAPSKALREQLGLAGLAPDDLCAGSGMDTAPAPPHQPKREIAP